MKSYVRHKSCNEIPFSSYAHQLSHELRTPLNHIRGFAELLLLDARIRSSHRDYIKAILHGSDTLQTAVLSHLKYVEELALQSGRRQQAKRRSLLPSRPQAIRKAPNYQSGGSELVHHQEIPGPEIMT